MSRRPQRLMLSSARLNWVMGLTGLIALAVAAHAAFLPMRYGEQLQAAAKRRAGLTAVGSFRGSIFDRNGVALAVTRPSVQIGVDLRTLCRELAAVDLGLDTFIADLSAEIGLDAADAAELTEGLEVKVLRGVLLYKELRASRDFESKKKLKAAISALPRYISLLKRQSLDNGRLLRRLKMRARVGKVVRKAARLEGAVPGYFASVVIEQQPQRSYPEGVLAAKLLGFTDSNLKGVEGVERAMNSALNPRQQLIRGARDRRRRFLPADEIPVSSELAGGDVYLTIDQRVQAHLEAVLADQVEAQQAEGGAAVVLDARSGAVLAMASVPLLNENDKNPRNSAQFRERVGAYGYDLGSTVKPFVVAKALDDGAIKDYQTLECDNGRIVIPGKRRPTFDHHKMDKCTVTEIIAHSSNVGVVKIGRITGLNPLRQYFEIAGITRTPPLGIGRPPRGALPRLRNGRLISRTDGEVMLFGYALRGTLLSITTSYMAFANAGVRVNPYLIDRVVKGDLEEVLPRGERKRIMSEKTASLILPMLEAVVHHGDDHPARIDGLRIGGKTGTSQKLVKGLGYHGHRKRFASFVGIAPLYQPRYVIGVMIDAPKDRYGAVAAAPVFRKVAHFALTRIAGMELPDLDAPSEQALALLMPEEPDEELGKAAVQIGDLLKGMADERRRSKRSSGALPDFVGLDARSALTELSVLDLDVKLSGSGRVLKQVPAPDTPISEIHGAIFLQLGTL
jgi:cell division protein FtsI (penicillin-binding protein 3)